MHQDPATVSTGINAAMRQTRDICDVDTHIRRQFASPGSNASQI